jgi:hypothetical protein
MGDSCEVSLSRLQYFGVHSKVRYGKVWYGKEFVCWVKEGGYVSPFPVTQPHRFHNSECEC